MHDFHVIYYSLNPRPFSLSPKLFHNPWITCVIPGEDSISVIFHTDEQKGFGFASASGSGLKSGDENITLWGIHTVSAGRSRIIGLS